MGGLRIGIRLGLQWLLKGGSAAPVFGPSLDYSDPRNSQYALMLLYCGGGPPIPSLDFSDSRNSQYALLLLYCGGGTPLTSPALDFSSAANTQEYFWAFLW